MFAALAGVVAAISPARRAAKLERAPSRSRTSSARRRGAVASAAIITTMPRLRLPDGSAAELPEGEPVGGAPARRRRGRRAGRRRAGRPLVRPAGEAVVEPVELGDRDGLHVLRHSTAHVMAQAVCDLYPGAKYAIGPAIEDGFYYDFELPAALSPDDLPRIEERDARDRRRPTSRSCARSVPRERGARAVRRPAVQARDRRGARARGGRDRRRGLGEPSTATTAGPTSAWARTCRPPAGSARSS